jgi:hypothetical protein
MVTSVGQSVELMIGRGNRNTRRKVPLCPPQFLHDLTGLEPRPPWWETGDEPPELPKIIFLIESQIPRPSDL